MADVQRLPFDPQIFLAKSGAGHAVSSYNSGDAISTQGDVCDSIFYILQGGVKLTVTSDRGKEAVIALLHTGEFFGEGCLTGQTTMLATVTALSSCQIARLSKPHIMRVIQEEPAFAEFFIAHVLARSAKTEADLIDQLFNSSEKRLARALLLLANFGKESQPIPVLPKISQETLADMIGTTRSRVSHFMNKFRKLGFIDYNGHIKVHASLLNLVLHEKPEIRPQNNSDGSE